MSAYLIRADLVLFLCQTSAASVMSTCTMYAPMTQVLRTIASLTCSHALVSATINESFILNKI